MTNKALLDGIRPHGRGSEGGRAPCELIGMIGAGVAGHGRAGAELGNAIKSVIIR